MLCRCFLQLFLFNDRFSWKFDRFLPKFVRKSPGRFSRKLGSFSMNSADNSVNPAEIRISKFWLFLRLCHCVSAEFSRISLNFSKTWSEFYLPAKLSNTGLTWSRQGPNKASNWFVMDCRFSCNSICISKYKYNSNSHNLFGYYNLSGNYFEVKPSSSLNSRLIWMYDYTILFWWQT
jgi:hypothetical protein